MKKLMLLVMLLALVATTGCGTTPIAATATPEKIASVDIEIDACLLISPEKVKEVSGLDVTSQPDSTPGESFCRYILANEDQAPLVTSVMTYTMAEEVNKTLQAAEWYELEKKLSQDISLFKIQDIANLGDKAYTKAYSFIDIIVLKTDVYYYFSTLAIDEGGIGYEALLELAEFALEKVP